MTILLGIMALGKTLATFKLLATYYLIATFAAESDVIACNNTNIGS